MREEESVEDDYDALGPITLFLNSESMFYDSLSGTSTWRSCLFTMLGSSGPSSRSFKPFVSPVEVFF